MAVTPQTNATIKDIACALLEHDDYVIAGHVSPDGDCLGSQLALMWALRSAGKKAVCVFEDDINTVSTGLMFLPGLQEMLRAKDVSSAKSFIAVDVPSHKRMGEEPARLHKGAEFTVTLDHHPNPERISDLAYVDPDAASATTIIWQLAAELGVDRAGNIATCAYTGLMTDTGRFQYQNANAEAFRLASEMVAAGVDIAKISSEVYQSRSLPSVKLEMVASNHMELLMKGRLAFTWISQEDFTTCDATKPDADVIIDTLRSIHGVRVACVLRETPEGARGSLRAKDDTDISIFAVAHNGGGHKAASGMTLTGVFDELVLQTREELIDYCREAWGE